MGSIVIIPKCCTPEYASENKDINLNMLNSLTNSVQKEEKSNKYESNNNIVINKKLLKNYHLSNNKTDSKGSYMINNNESNIKNDGLNNLLTQANKINNQKENTCKTYLSLTGELFNDEEIIIDPGGIINCCNKKNTCMTIFGTKNDYKDDINENIDYYINFGEIDITGGKVNKSRKNNKVFKIDFEPSSNNYSITFLNDKSILYLKITEDIYFIPNKEYYIILGTVFLVVFVRAKNDKESILKISVEIDSKKSHKYKYKKEQCPIHLGRSNADIVIQQKSISKVHGKFDFK